MTHWKLYEFGWVYNYSIIYNRPDGAAISISADLTTYISNNAGI